MGIVFAKSKKSYTTKESKGHKPSRPLARLNSIKEICSPSQNSKPVRSDSVIYNNQIPKCAIVKGKNVEESIGKSEAQNNSNTEAASAMKQASGETFMNQLVELNDKLKTETSTETQGHILKEICFLPHNTGKEAGQAARKKLISEAVKISLHDTVSECLATFVDNGLFDLGYTSNAYLWGVRVVINFGNIHSYPTEFAKSSGQNEITKTSLSILGSTENKQLLENGNEDVDQLLKDILNLMHCLSRIPENRNIIRDAGAVDVLSDYLAMKNDKYMMARSLMALANLVDENEASQLENDSGSICLLIELLKEALSNDEHRYVWAKGHLKYTLFVRDLMICLEKVSVVDENKVSIVKAEALPVLNDVFKVGTDFDKTLAAKTVWSICFNKDCQRSVIESALPVTLEKFTTDENNELRKEVKGALWKINESEQIDRPVSRSANKKGHVMLSYSWSQQKLLQNINKALWANGYDVWMDIEQMSGSTLEAMASAVEESRVVVICISSNYKDSPSCRTEAEYTFQLRKPYIPLMVEKGYKPDGWLGMMLGSKLYIDFSDPAQFQDAITKLCSELGRVGVSGSGACSRVAIDTVDNVASKRKDELSVWTDDEITKWISSKNLCHEKLKKHFGCNITGPMLGQLQYMQLNTPLYLYESLSKMGLEFAEILKLTAALNTLDI